MTLSVSVITPVTLEAALKVPMMTRPLPENLCTSRERRADRLQIRSVQNHVWEQQYIAENLFTYINSVLACKQDVNKALHAASGTSE